MVFCQFFFLFSPLFAFFLSVLLSFLLFRIDFCFIVLHFSSSFSTLFYSCFFGSCGFISNLPQLAWDKRLGWLVVSSFNMQVQRTKATGSTLFVGHCKLLSEYHTSSFSGSRSEVRAHYSTLYTLDNLMLLCGAITYILI
jgi:hypothetical protein